MADDRELAEILAKLSARIVRLEELGPRFYLASDGAIGITVDQETFDTLNSDATQPAHSRGFANPDSVEVERLCAHHEIDQFNAGEGEADLFNDILHSYYDEFCAGGTGIAAVYCAVVNHRVVGYVAISTLEISTGDQIKRYVSVPALATDHEFRDGPRALVLRALLRRVLQWREAQDPQHERYLGVAAIPSLNPAIDRFLRRLGFGPVSTDPFFWVGPFPRGNFLDDDIHEFN